MAFDATDFPLAKPAVDPLTLTTPRERLEYMRDLLRALPREKFSLVYWFHREDRRSWGWNPSAWANTTNASALEGSCGTSACIAGHALAVFRPNQTVPARPDVAAAELLGLTPIQAADLFQPFDLPGDMLRSDVSREMAAHAIDHLLRTGEVDWSVARSGQ